VHKQKFTQFNISYYNKFIVEIEDIDKENILYLDETHLDKRYFKSIRCWGIKGEKIKYKKNMQIGGKSYSVTVLMGLHGIKYEIRTKNKANDFIKFILDIINEDPDYLRNKIIIIDNSKCHRAKIVRKILHPVLLQYSVQLLFLPTYSPELNPIELILVKLKDTSGKIMNCTISNSLSSYLLLLQIVLVK